jgi:hypothetical protein
LRDLLEFLRVLGSDMQEAIGCKRMCSVGTYDDHIGDSDQASQLKQCAPPLPALYAFVRE